MTGTSGPRTGRVRGLIVDDEAALDEVLSVAVTAAGRRSCAALDGRGALRTARGRAPHAVVLDGMPPGLNGLQVPRRLRFEDPKLPVLTLTAKEYDLLGALLAHPRQIRRILSKAPTLDHVRRGSFDGGGNLVEVPISHPRRKIHKRRAPMIHPVRGLGYAIRAAEDGR
ncbi:DNA-binding response regulator [Streptomyces sviceus]|uniref:response regulator transcription factor n=1 Tax=Streptomyces sviceus TaxID=285530 RepID=UPI003805BD68